MKMKRMITATFMSTCECRLLIISDFIHAKHSSFVDRDMYMRYAGGGVGHYQIELKDNHEPQLDGDAQAVTPSDVRQEDEAQTIMRSDVQQEDHAQQEDGAQQENPIHSNAVVGEVEMEEDGEGGLQPQGPDNGSDSGSESGDDEGVAEVDDLPEDGEGGFVDAEDEEGYAEL